jgi:hypothetical protein
LSRGHAIIDTSMTPSLWPPGQDGRALGGDMTLSSVPQDAVIVRVARSGSPSDLRLTVAAEGAEHGLALEVLAGKWSAL